MAEMWEGKPPFSQQSHLREAGNELKTHSARHFGRHVANVKRVQNTKNVYSITLTAVSQPWEKITTSNETSEMFPVPKRRLVSMIHNTK